MTKVIERRIPTTRYLDTINVMDESHKQIYKITSNVSFENGTTSQAADQLSWLHTPTASQDIETYDITKNKKLTTNITSNVTLTQLHTPQHKIITSTPKEKESEKNTAREEKERKQQQQSTSKHDERERKKRVENQPHAKKRKEKDPEMSEEDQLHAAPSKTRRLTIKENNSSSNSESFKNNHEQEQRATKSKTPRKNKQTSKKNNKRIRIYTEQQKIAMAARRRERKEANIKNPNMRRNTRHYLRDEKTGRYKLMTADDIRPDETETSVIPKDLELNKDLPRIANIEITDSRKPFIKIKRVKMIRKCKPASYKPVTKFLQLPRDILNLSKILTFSTNNHPSPLSKFRPQINLCPKLTGNLSPPTTSNFTLFPIKLQMLKGVYSEMLKGDSTSVNPDKNMSDVKIETIIEKIKSKNDTEQPTRADTSTPRTRERDSNAEPSTPQRAVTPRYVTTQQKRGEHEADQQPVIQTRVSNDK
ncbi:uncharacterized protein LOC105203532 [Solenopsis invicta]|uniref:uncharacterized protein LOC105203532 n=1 Tax=Solenopsis invicta TaxID=13686 RepID=UPI00193D8760|nr:uncharacterized protein LOC105203532 [Solenopsis invicta]